ncbi:Cupin domain protein [Streptomyces sp. TLI_053]|uniref:cupin domain-containing protein n=1 Tax=Streptomyces sp. TLI_053 TaxID=1855352 RepID=UPI00087A66E8|nr:cupin domain-containing protein [Streptomyces sp. TLI_053]SDS82361.1 Cupin domain protein [Streptomyces sp. TLI_053]
MTEEPNAGAPATAPDDPAAPVLPAAPTVSVVGPGEGETVLLGTTRMRILEDGTTTGHRLGIAESVIAPHTPGPPQHRHAGHDEGFYVVSGSVRFTVGSEEHDAVAGTLVVVPPGAPHTFANVGDEPAVMLSTFTPDPYVRYFRELRDLHAGAEAVTPEAQLGLMRRYATEPASAPTPGPS